MSQDTNKNDFLHKEYPKQFRRDEFWQQIKRTVNGNEVSEADIELIVSQIESHLALQKADRVLDLGCGNAALASRFFAKVAKYTGVDFSAYLLEVAREYFQAGDNIGYIESDIREISRYSPDASGTNKVLIYGCIAYLSKSDVTRLLLGLKNSFADLQTIFIGNVPNRDRAADFFAARTVLDFDLDDPTSPIGVWWEPAEFVRSAEALGFEAVVAFMPESFYGGPYRFDVRLNTH